MANLSYSTTVQNKAAYRLFQNAYSTLTTEQKAVLDGASGSASPPTDGVAQDAWNYINSYAQWVYLAGASAAPDVWERWLIARMVYLAGPIIRPEREAQYRDVELSEMRSCLSSYCANDPNGSAVDTNATSLSVKGIRFYVLGGAIRRNPPIYINPADIDAATIKVIRDLWNRADWNWKRRDCQMTVTPLDITGASYTHSSKTLTKTGTYSVLTIPAGTIVNVTDGTGATAGKYYVASGSCTATTLTIVLTTSIGAGADAQTDIEFNTTPVTFDLLSTEKFQKCATRKWYMTSDSYRGQFIEWCPDGDSFIRNSHLYPADNTGIPCYFRYSRTGDLQYNWQFAPRPSGTFTYRGEVFIRYPGDPSSSTDTAVFDLFPTEIHPIIRDLVYGEVMSRYDQAEGAAYLARANDALERIVPLSTDQGRSDAEAAVRDVYLDRANTSSSSWTLGGNYGGGL